MAIPRLSLPRCDSFLVCICEAAAQLVFRSFSEGIVPYVAVDSVCAWEEVSSGIFLRHHRPNILAPVRKFSLLWHWGTSD